MTWTANDVLDTYADLVRRLRTPADSMASFMAFQMNAALGKRQKRGQFYPVLPTPPGWAVTDRQGAEFAGFLGTGLFGAPVYQVTQDMCAAIGAMFDRTVAEEAPIIYQATLPATAGFVWLDHQLELEPEDGPLNRIQALSWAVHNVLTDTGPMPALRVALWMLASDTTQDDDGRTPASAADIAQIQGWLGAVTLLYTDVYPLDTPLVQQTGVPPRSAVALVAYLNMLWMMLQMEITGIDRAVGIRGARRRARRDAGQSDVLVVTLRRARASKAGEPSGEHRDIEWSHRWIVQTHYRHHDAPGRDSWHHALPSADKKHCAVCGGEVSYIPPYIKGPDGAPLRVRRRLNRLSR